MLGYESSEECLCIIFHNWPDMEDSVNSTVDLTNFLFSGVRLALFRALKASTGSGKRKLKSFNLVTCRTKSIRKSSQAVSDSLQMFRMLKRQFISSRKSVSSFLYKFFIPSSELRTAVSNSKISFSSFSFQ